MAEFITDLSGILPVEDLDGDELGDFVVVGIKYELGQPIGGVSVLSAGTGELVTPPDADLGDVFGLAQCEVPSENGGGLVIFDGEQVALERRNLETGERIWKSESLGRDWSRGFVGSIGDVDGDSVIDYAISGLEGGTSNEIRWSFFAPRPYCESWAEWLRSLRFAGGAVVSGRTGEMLAALPGFGSSLLPGQSQRGKSELLLCLESGPGKVRLGRFAHGGELVSWEFDVGEGFITIEPFVLSNEGAAFAAACVVAVDYAAKTSEVIMTKADSGEVLARVRLDGVVTAAIAQAANMSVLATRVICSGEGAGSSELIAIGDVCGEAKLRVLRSFGQDWRPPEALGQSVSGTQIAVGFPRTIYRFRPDLEDGGVDTPSSGSGGYHHHQGRVAVLELRAGKVVSQREIAAPLKSRGFGQTVSFLRSSEVADEFVLAIGACDAVFEDWFGEVLVFRGAEELELTARFLAKDW